MEDVWKKAVEIVQRIERDLSDRKGLGDEWGQIDPEIREEIRKTWIEACLDVLEK